MSDRADTADFQAITERQKETWATGDFHEIARQNVFMAEALCAAVDPHATDRVLDVACGSGTAALVLPCIGRDAALTVAGRPPGAGCAAPCARMAST